MTSSARVQLPLRIWVTGALLAVLGVAIVVNLIAAVTGQGRDNPTTEIIFAVLWVLLSYGLWRDYRQARDTPPEQTPPDDTPPDGGTTPSVDDD